MTDIDLKELETAENLLEGLGGGDYYDTLEENEPIYNVARAYLAQKKAMPDGAKIIDSQCVNIDNK